MSDTNTQTEREAATTKVVFRWYRRYGECVALFPQIAADNQGYSCQSYMHVGQHGAADPDCVVAQTRLATSEEYESLAKELRSRGYHLDIRKRCTRHDQAIRRESVL